MKRKSLIPRCVRPRTAITDCDFLTAASPGNQINCHLATKAQRCCQPGQSPMQPKDKATSSLFCLQLSSTLTRNQRQEHPCARDHHPQQPHRQPQPEELTLKVNPALAPTPVTPWVWDLTSENLSTSRPCSPLTDMSISLFCSSRSSASEYFQEASVSPELPGRVKCRTLSKDTCQSTDCQSAWG